MTKEEHDALMQLWGSQFNLGPSSSPYAPPAEGNRWSNREKISNVDGMTHALFVEHNAIVLGLEEDIKLINDATKYNDPDKAERASIAWNRIPEEFKAAARFTKEPELK